MSAPALPPILILEDEELVRLALAEELSDAGLVVHDARSVEDARALFNAHPEIGIVVTDITLKGEEGGLEFCDFVLAARPALRQAYARARELKTGYAMNDKHMTLFPWEDIQRNMIVT